MDDPLKKLLEQTGWSYEDVLKRLEQYKQESVLKTSSETNSDTCDKTNSTKENIVFAENNHVINSEKVDTNSKELTTAQCRRKRKISDEAISQEVSPVLVTTDSFTEDTISYASNNQDECDPNNEDDLDCKKIRLSCSTDISEIDNDNILCTTEADERIELMIDKEELTVNDRIEECLQMTSSKQGKDLDEVNGEDKEPEHYYQPLNKLISIETPIVYEEEDTSECKRKTCENDRLKDIDKIKKESEIKCEDAQCKRITKRRKNKRKPNLKGDIDNNRCCEIIQEDKCDNTFSTSNMNIMKNLTKSLNKRRKLSESNDSNPCSSVSDQNQSLTTNSINEENTKKFHTITEEITKSSVDKNAFTLPPTSDETDSNKENADLDFSRKVYRNIIQNQNTLEENFINKDSDIPKISYSSIITEDAFFDEVKSRYMVKLKNEIFPKDSLSQISDDNKTDNVQRNAVFESTSKISENNQNPDFIELLKKEIFNSPYEPTEHPKKRSEKSQSIKLIEDNSIQQSEEHLSNSNVDITDSRYCGERKTKTDENKCIKSGKLSNIISIIRKKLENDCTEDDNEKFVTDESSSSNEKPKQDSTLSNQAIKKHRRQNQILILKKTKFNTSVQSNLKTYANNHPDIGASSSNSSSSEITPLAKKKSRKFNTDRLTNITNILSQKLSNINKDLDGKEEVSDDEDSNLKIINVVGGYKSPTSDLDTTRARSSKEINRPSHHIEQVMLPINESMSKYNFGIGTYSKNNKTMHPVLPTNTNDAAHTLIKESGVDQSSTVQTETAIKPTKTKDVTKIKGWKKKKFAVESPVLKEKTEDIRNVATMSFNSSLPGPSNSMPCSSSQTHSVFTSDILDQYLTENAGLNISYEVPKLEAEQTLQQTYTDIKFPKREQQVAKTEKIQEKKDKKPKTLAEKRKMEERPASRLLEDLLQIETPTSKHYTAMLLKLKQKMLTENIPFSRKSLVGSSSLTNTECFVLYNNRKIKIPSSKSNKVLCKLFHKEPVPQRRKQKKLSLLQSLSQKGFCYDPKEWEAVEKQLPKIYLEFIPTIGKRLHPKISHLIESNETVLNRQRVNYALSVLKTPVPVPPKRFLFRVPFSNNQKTVSLQKRIVSDANDDELSVGKVELEETVEDAVKHVMDKMLKYVDVLDETKDIVLADDVYDTVHCTQTQPRQNKGTRNVKFKEFKRTAFEMKRLNCKFVSISTEEENAINKPCLKDHCRLGCVCKSIEGSVSNFFETHCGLYKCMFQCTCKKQNTQQYSNVFSECIINRLQDEATKNLAKVEKEFTQTIIQTNNQLIVVGDSTERKKRVARAPKKYDDFVEQDFFEEEIPKALITPPKPLMPTKLVYNNVVYETCYVKLANYDFKDIIPFCMEHSLYKCHCKLESSQPTATRVLPSANENLVPVPVASTQQEQFKPNKDTIDKDTSRTKGIPSSYYLLRNKTQTHLMRIEKTTKLLERQLNKYLKENADHILGTTENNTLMDNSASRMLKSSSNSISTISPQKCVLNNNDEYRPNLRLIENTKQTESVISPPPPHPPPPTPPSQDTIVEKEPKIQRRRIKQSTRDNSVVQKNDSVTENRTNQIQQSEKEFCMFLAKHNSQVRILPWSVLLSRYENGSFQLWTLLVPDAPVLLTENGKRPTSNHCNVKVFEHLSRTFDHSCDIIRYIINKETPLGKSKDQVWVLFLETSINIWRICGICDKNESKKDFSISIITLYGRLEDIIKESAENILQENLVIAGNKTIVSSKRHYLPKKLLPEANPKYKHIELAIWASVPNITSSCKWRIISLKNSFTYLSFSRCKYTIEYNDILKAVELTQSNKLTLALRSRDLHRSYPHRKFGIYCDYYHPDRIFVGPYFTHENFDLTFLILKNNILMDSSMVKHGRAVAQCGYWYRQAAPVEEHADDDVQLIPDDTALIDLTTDSDNEQSMNHFAESEFHIVSKTEAAEVDASEIDSDSKEKRYIITNVPAVGYILAAINANNYLDIVCPITGKTKTFMHAPSTIRILQRILIRKFILVPHTFKLEVTLVDKINSNRYKPLDSSILNGYHMVGQFGVRNASTVTVQDLSKFGLTNSEVLQVLEQRERKLLLLPLTTLSKLLNVHIPNKAPFISSLHKIAEAAQNAVEHLHREEANHIDQTIHLHDKKKALTKHCLQLVVNLPPAERKREQNRLHKILKSYTSRVDRIKHKCNDLLTPAPSDTLDDHLEDHVEMKNLFDETRVIPKTYSKTRPKTSLTSAVLRPMPRNMITRTPTKNSSSNTNGEDKPVNNVTTSLSAISNLVPEISKNLKLINNTALKRKQGKSLLKPSDKKMASSGVPNKVLNTTPVLSKISIPKASTLNTSTSGPSIKSPSHIKLAQNVKPTTSSGMVVTLPPAGPISTVKIGKSTYLARSSQQTSLKYPKNSNAANNSMATVTPLPKKSLKNDASKNNPNFIALKDGDRMRYFQLVSEKKSLPANQSAVITKKPGRVVKKHTKKIILSSASSANTDQKTVT